MLLKPSNNPTFTTRADWNLPIGFPHPLDHVTCSQSKCHKEHKHISLGVPELAVLAQELHSSDFTSALTIGREKSVL